MTSQTHDAYEPTWTLGDRLRRIRRDADVTQKQFAELLQVKDKRYGAWESDTNMPSGGDLMTIARRVQLLYGAPARDFLLGIKTHETPQPDGPEGVDGDERAWRYSKPQPSDPKVLPMLRVA